MSATPQSKRKKKLIASVHRAVEILNLFDLEQVELGTTEIARELGLPKSTAAGLVLTLEDSGLLEQNPVTRKYRLGYKLAEYAGILLNQTDLRQLAMPQLESLLQWCNESVNLAVLDDSHVVYIERLYGTNLLGMRSEIGKHEPVHSTALGKAILAFTPSNEARKFLETLQFTRRTPKTIASLPAFEQDLALTRERGFALDDEENELGGRCVAAPVLDHRSKPVAALSISAPVQRLPVEQVPEFGARVCEAARQISQRLGYLRREGAGK